MYKKISHILVMVVYICFLLFIGICYSLPHEPIIITEVNITPADDNKDVNAFTSVVVNNTLQINSIRLVGDRIKMPEYVSSTDAVYPQVLFASKGISKIFEDAILDKKISGESTGTLSYEITNLIPFKGSSRKANAHVTFNGSITVVCGVMETIGDVWIAWPAYKNDAGKWKRQVTLLSRDLQEKVESSIIQLYNEWKIEKPDQ